MSLFKLNTEIKKIFLVDMQILRIAVLISLLGIMVNFSPKKNSNER